MKNIVLLVFFCLFSGRMLAQVPKIPDVDWATEQNVSQYENNILQCATWLQQTPMTTMKNTRKDINNFVSQWSSANTAFRVHLFSDIVKFEEGDLLISFIAGWCEYAIKTRDYDKLNCAMAGIDVALLIYANNKTTLRKNKQAEKLQKLKNKGKLREKISKHLEKYE